MESAKYCPKCLEVIIANRGDRCSQCNVELGELFDSAGAMTAEYLKARGYCCGNGCRNCPYTGSEKK